MTLTINFGNIDLPYAHDPEGTTTGEVAQFLEDKYHIYEIFFETHEEEVAQMVTEGLAGTLESILSGASPPPDPFAAGAEDVTARFRQFLELEEMAGTGTPGVPTKASVKRRSLRFKAKVNPDSKGRVSFYDTGEYMATARVWVTEDGENADGR